MILVYYHHTTVDLLSILLSPFDHPIIQIEPSALLFARVFEVVFPNGIIVFFFGCSIPLNAVFRQGRHGVGWGC